MKYILISLMCMLSFQTLMSQTSGGPDTFGYSWKNSDDPQGPVFNWIDISSSGTLINGILDDNSVGPFTLPFQFNYYASTYSELKVGSNGWVSLSNVGNVSHCFAAIPSSSGSNNLICPFTADLNFDSTSGPNYGRVYYQTLGTDTFIVSFIDAPFWINATINFVGYNTFQVIFDASDYSITFQYLQMEESLATYVVACPRNSVVGIENEDGTIGLEVYADTNLPPDSMALKFTCNGCFTIGMEEAKYGLHIFPNPAEDIVKVETEGLEYVELFEGNGRVLQRVYDNTLDVSNYPSGVYFLKVQTINETFFEKLFLSK